jgi:hypothetical protein
VAGVLGLIVAWRNLGERRKYLFLLVPAAIQVLAIGLISRGDPRFIFFPIALIVVAGAVALGAWFSVRPYGSWSHAAGWGLAVVLVGSLALSAAEARRWVQNRSDNNEAIEVAADAVADIAGGEPCGVLTSYTPQITFYSACASEIFIEELGPQESLARLRGDDRLMVLIEGGKRQPVGDDLADLIALTTGPPVVIDTSKKGVLIYRFQD